MKMGCKCPQATLPKEAYSQTLYQGPHFTQHHPGAMSKATLGWWRCDPASQQFGKMAAAELTREPMLA